jgi:hypothetical protein
MRNWKSPNSTSLKILARSIDRIAAMTVTVNDMECLDIGCSTPLVRVVLSFDDYPMEQEL